MSIHFNKQSQFELFPGDPDYPQDNSSSRFFLSRLTLSLESLVVVGIVFILTIVIAYSLGVERGKKMNRTPKAEENPPAEVQVTSETVSSVEKKPVLPASAGLGTARELQKTEQPLVAPIVNMAEAVKSAGRANPAIKKSSETGPSEKTVDKGYTIQVASYQKDEYAQTAAADFKAREGQETVVLQKGKFWIVCIGKFAQKNDAQAYLKKLKKKNYKDCLVRSF